MADVVPVQPESEEGHLLPRTHPGLGVEFDGIGLVHAQLFTQRPATPSMPSLYAPIVDRSYLPCSA
jgi:hypothetical protein